MIFWLAFATLSYEIVLGRVFAYLLPYHFTPVAISLAMLGLGAGACLRAHWRHSHDRENIAGALAALALAFLLFDATLFVHWGFWALVAAGFPPFLLLGALISRIYGTSAHPQRTYSLDLVGGSLACLVVLPIFDLIGPIWMTLCLACASAAAALAVVRTERRALRIVCVLAAVLAAAASGAWFSGRIADPALAPRRGAAKPMHEALRREKGRIADFAWGSAGRADLYEHPSFKGIKWIYNDATNSSYLIQEPNTPARRDFLRGLALNIPCALSGPRRVLIVGSGGGIEIGLARLAGAPEIDALEINPAVVMMVRRWADFAGPVYDAPGVNVHVEDGRRFLSSSRGRYDLIQMSLAYTATSLSGSQTLAEGYLYTVEAFRLYLQRLNPGGLLAFFDDSRERALREAATALAVFREQGVPPEAALRRMAIIGNPGRDGTGYAFLVLVSPGELSLPARKRLMELCGGRFVPLWVPDFADDKPFTSSLREGLDGKGLDLRPRTDDYPYFFFFGKGWRESWRVLRPVALLCGLALLFAAGAAGAAGRRPPGVAWRAGALAALCGMSFMLVEAGLLQKLMLTTSTPAQALSLLLFSLLFWCGLGGRLASALRGRRPAGLPTAFAVAAAAALACVLLLGRWYRMEGVSSEALRRLLVFLMLGPVGLSLGVPFPALLDLHAKQGRNTNALLWGINGFASVAGACLSIMFSFSFGIDASILAGAGGYLAAAVVAARPASDRGES